MFGKGELTLQSFPGGKEKGGLPRKEKGLAVVIG